jgi:hypothetical protein
MRSSSGIKTESKHKVENGSECMKNRAKIPRKKLKNFIFKNSEKNTLTREFHIELNEFRRVMPGYMMQRFCFLSVFSSKEKLNAMI